MIIGRLIGWVFMIAALAVVALEGIAFGETGTWDIKALGVLWYELHPDTLNGFQVLIQRTLDVPWLWEDVIQPVLLWPAWAVLGGIGIIFLILFRAR